MRDNEIRFLTIAEIDVDEAVSWYQKQSEDQNLKFLEALASLLEQKPKAEL